MHQTPEELHMVFHLQLKQIACYIITFKVIITAQMKLPSVHVQKIKTGKETYFENASSIQKLETKKKLWAIYHISQFSNIFDSQNVIILLKINTTCYNCKILSTPGKLKNSQRYNSICLSGLLVVVEYRIWPTTLSFITFLLLS